MSNRSEQLSDLRQKTVGQLENEVKELRETVNEKQVTRFFEGAKDVHKLRRTRKKLARAITVLREKEKEEA